MVLEQVLKENPQIVAPGTQTKYSLIVVKPDPSIDYKIVHITPDPNVDYKIIVADPRSGDKVPGLSRQLGGALRETLQERRKEPEE